MAKNSLAELNDHLFAQLERLSDESLTGERLAEEISRADAVTDIAQEIIACGSLVLKAKIAADNSISGGIVVPKMLEG